MKRITRLAAILLAALLLMGMTLTVGMAYYVPVTGIQTAGRTVLKVGETVHWSASAQPANATDKSLYWAAGNPGVATVNQDGYITAHKVGQCNISITAKNGFQKVILVNVAAINTAGKTVLKVGETTKWTASVVPANTPNKSLWWAAGNPGVATVDQNGNITARKAGKCNISITAKNGMQKVILLTVTGGANTTVPVTGISTAGKTKLTVGEKVKWTASVAPANATNKSLSWTAGNPGVATVDQNGNITAKKAGQCNITIFAGNNVKKTILVTVTDTSTSLFNRLAGKEFCFTSGVGGWMTNLEINADGSFAGAFHDSDMGVTGPGYDSTCYICDFSGRFTSVRKISDYEYSMQLNSLSYKDRPGKEWIEKSEYGRIKYIASTAYGLDELGEIRVYLKGCKTSAIPSACLEWCQALNGKERSGIMSYDVIYCVKGEHPFVMFE